MANKPSASRHSRRLYRGDRVLVARDLGDSMRHFSGAGKPAIVLGSYGDLCHGDDHGSYSLLFEGGPESWYRREQLTENGQRATEEEIEMALSASKQVPRMTYKPEKDCNYWCCPICRRPVRCAVAGKTPRHGHSTVKVRGKTVEYLSPCRGSGMPADLEHSGNNQNPDYPQLNQQRSFRMADFNTAVTKTLIREGGSKITNDLTDKGGLTKYGIAKASHPNVDIVNLTEEQAKAIYRAEYWQPIKGDQIINQTIAEALFDTAVNMGVGMAVKLAQQALKIGDDGVLGPGTLTAVNTAGQDSIGAALFLSYYKLAKIARYVGICKKDDSQRRFLVGWISRTLES